MSKPGVEEWPEHPLFPRENDEPAKRVDFIQVIRHEDGRSKQIPRMFRADELKSLEDIFHLWGGGVYELWGRQASIHNPESHGKVNVNRRYEIAGLSKPLTVDGANAIPASAPAPLAHATAAGAPPDTSVMGMFMQMQMTMMQAAQENARQTALAQQAANERARQESMQSQQAMMQMQTTMMQGMLGVVTAVISTAKAGSGVDDVSKMASLFQTLGVLGKKTEPGEGVDDESTLKTLGQIVADGADVVQGMVELRKTNGTPEPAAAGSAAGVLGVPPVRKPDTVI
jgi:hypothetical protein